jgi:hypothetical protein
MSDEPVAPTVVDHQAGTRRVFVVHLRLDADPSRGQVTGRIQHSHTNDAAHFESVDELLAFIAAHVTCDDTQGLESSAAFPLRTQG